MAYNHQVTELVSSSNIAKNEDLLEIAINEKLDADEKAKYIFEYLIDDAVLELSFEVNRLLKFGCYDLGKIFFIQQRCYANSKPQVKEVPKTVISCPICQLVKGAKNFTTHLAVCMGISTKRKASQKNSKDQKHVSNISHISVPRKTYQDMTLDELEEFLSKKCGVISIRNQTLCTKSLNCSTHKREDRDYVRQFLGVSSNQMVHNGETAVENTE